MNPTNSQLDSALVEDSWTHQVLELRRLRSDERVARSELAQLGDVSQNEAEDPTELLERVALPLSVALGISLLTMVPADVGNTGLAVGLGLTLGLVVVVANEWFRRRAHSVPGAETPIGGGLVESPPEPVERVVPPLAGAVLGATAAWLVQSAGQPLVDFDLRSAVAMTWGGLLVASALARAQYRWAVRTTELHTVRTRRARRHQLEERLAAHTAEVARLEAALCAQKDFGLWPGALLVRSCATDQHGSEPGKSDGQPTLPRPMTPSTGDVR